MGIQTRRRRCNSRKGLEQDRKYQETKTEEEIEKERECSRMYMRKLQSSQSLEEVERRQEKGRPHRKSYLLRHTPEEIARQRERSRLYMQRLRASQTPEEVEKRREKGRMYKKLSILRQTPEEAARQREQNRIYMQRVRASETPEEVEKRKERNRMYKRLSVLRRTPEEAAKRREQHRLYMRQLRAAKMNNDVELSRTQGQSVPCLISEGDKNAVSVGVREASQTNETAEHGKCNRTVRHQKQMTYSSAIDKQGASQGEIASRMIEMNRLIRVKGADMEEHTGLSIGTSGQRTTMEEVEREFNRHIWQHNDFWEYLALLNKTQPDQSMATFQTPEDEGRKIGKRN